MATHCSTLAWIIPWTEWPGGLQSTGSQREEHNWSDLAPTQLSQRLNLIKIRSKLSFKYAYFILIYMEKQRGGEVLAKMSNSEERRASSHLLLFPTNLILCKDINHCPLRKWGPMFFSRHTFRICLKSTPILGRSKSYSCVQGMSPCLFLCFILSESQGSLLWNSIAHSLTQMVFILNINYTLEI